MLRLGLGLGPVALRRGNIKKKKSQEKQKNVLRAMLRNLN